MHNNLVDAQHNKLMNAHVKSYLIHMLSLFYKRKGTVWERDTNNRWGEMWEIECGMHEKTS